eukprot:TRINITY_DN2334_c0_g1_i1.p1 TRINITY_DN2334_c0_g1~~TRINITY_DN2334_c0_g1_i1.p1  ORF type:complete len:197 (+),score=104.37 TRINITY_DN2334_c0_g1_i1:252-842(+)
MLKAVVLLFAIFAFASAQAPSICDKYSTALNVSNSDLVTLVVSQTVNAALNSDLKQFFDGTTPPGSTDFTSNSAAFNTLATHLVQFFGAALGCTDGSIGAYTGNPDMKAVHANMPITLAYFNAFNSALLNVLTTNGVTQADANAVGAVLESTKPAICNQPDCNPSATTGAGTTGSPASVNTVFVAMTVFAAVVAMF